ncbi:LuxR C-terminal-related transcriptional regulator [Klebsiella variicola]|uniref:LuxR C-terminal-related transcriptional regulator n=1 Tax=Klebsiella variicola TaxID=244366 RepID=UPI002B054274|nr:LuxR C-terminal-related transcriptional regulator [Klebsiella variicola]
MKAVSFFTKGDLFSESIVNFLKANEIHAVQYNIEKASVGSFETNEELIVVNLCSRFKYSLFAILSLNSMASKIKKRVIFICTSEIQSFYYEVVDVNDFYFLLVDKKYTHPEVKDLFYGHNIKRKANKRLTKRECLIFMMVIYGASITNVSKSMGVDYKTISTHVRNSCYKLNENNIRCIHKKLHFY